MRLLLERAAQRGQRADPNLLDAVDRPAGTLGYLREAQPLKVVQHNDVAIVLGKTGQGVGQQNRLLATGGFAAGRARRRLKRFGNSRRPTQRCVQLPFEAHVTCLIRSDTALTDEERASGKLPSRWLVMAHKLSDVAALADNPRWRRASGRPDTPVWTDQYCNILQLFQRGERSVLARKD